MPAHGVASVFGIVVILALSATTVFVEGLEWTVPLLFAWLVIIILAALIHLTIAMLHVDSPAATLITMFLFGTAVAASMLLIVAYDQPFSSGGIRVLPTALQDVMPD